MRRTDATLSIGSHGGFGRDAQVTEHSAQLGRRLERAHRVLQGVQPLQVDSAGDTSPALSAALVGAGSHSPSERTSPEDVVVVRNRSRDVVQSADGVVMRRGGSRILDSLRTQILAVTAADPRRTTCRVRRAES